jgi:hypothetical protein
MVARHVERFTVTTPDDLSDLEACLSDGRVESALVEIPDGSSALLSAREFRQVVRLARDHEIEIAFSTDDPLRRELARIVGGKLSLDPAPGPDPDADAATRKLDGAAQLSTTTEVSPRATVFRPWQAPVSDTDAVPMDVEYDQSNPSFSFVVNPPRLEHSTPTVERKAATHDPLYEVWDGYTPPDPLFHRSQRAAPKKKRRKAGHTIGALMIVAAILASGLLTAIVVLPSATIHITPATHPINAVVTYGLQQPGLELDLVVQPEPLSTVLSFEAIIPATGTRVEPDGAAAGSVLLTNTSTVDIVVPAGTVFTSETGISFQSSEDALVPAADPFGTLTVGSATIHVAATTPGPDGNIGPESIRGQLDSGVYYTNRDSFSGGSVREITVVSPDDLAALRQRAEDDLNARAATALESRLASDQSILDGTKQREEIRYVFDHQVGEDAQVVKVQATLELSASTYRLGDIHEQARAEVSRRLSGSVDPDTAIIPASISIEDPQPVAGSDGLTFSIAAAATTRAVINVDDLAELEADLVGLSAEQALARIRQVKGVESIDVQYDRDWFGERMPRLQSRISIEVLDATGVSSQATSPGP